jgi:hypothetical protein
VNEVLETSQEKFNDIYRVVGGLSCDSPTFFVPVLAGTVIRSMEVALSGSTHPPCHIPLPLLSFESSLRIIKEKLPKLFEITSEQRYIRQLVADTGGHARTLEILHDTLKSKGIDPLNTRWTSVANIITTEVSNCYAKTRWKLDSAIAASIVSEEVCPGYRYPDGDKLLWTHLEERGLIQIVDDKVCMPYFFMVAFLRKSVASFTPIWEGLLLRQGDYFWQNWELFNRDYIALRLACHSYLGKTQITLDEFFKGAKMSVHDNMARMKIEIPTKMTVGEVEARYPTTEQPRIPVGHVTMTAAGAPFDSFVYVRLASESKKQVLLAFHMKFSRFTDDGNGKLTKKHIEEEYEKVQKSMSDKLPDMNFILIFLLRCETNCSVEDLPPNTILISKSEHESFYGLSLKDRIVYL